VLEAGLVEFPGHGVGWAEPPLQKLFAGQGAQTVSAAAVQAEVLNWPLGQRLHTAHAAVLTPGA
jgi:hypothetical protein